MRGVVAQAWMTVSKALSMRSSQLSMFCTPGFWMSMRFHLVRCSFGQLTESVSALLISIGLAPPRLASTPLLVSGSGPFFILLGSSFLGQPAPAPRSRLAANRDRRRFARSAIYSLALKVPGSRDGPVDRSAHARLTSC